MKIRERQQRIENESEVPLAQKQLHKQRAEPLQQEQPKQPQYEPKARHEESKSPVVRENPKMGIMELEPCSETPFAPNQGGTGNWLKSYNPSASPNEKISKDTVEKSSTPIEHKEDPVLENHDVRQPENIVEPLAERPRPSLDMSNEQKAAGGDVIDLYESSPDAYNKPCHAFEHTSPRAESDICVDEAPPKQATPLINQNSDYSNDEVRFIGRRSGQKSRDMSYESERKQSVDYMGDRKQSQDQHMYDDQQNEQIKPHESEYQQQQVEKCQTLEQKYDQYEVSDDSEPEVVLQQPSRPQEHEITNQYEPRVQNDSHNINPACVEPEKPTHTIETSMQPSISRLNEPVEPVQTTESKVDVASTDHDYTCQKYPSISSHSQNDQNPLISHPNYTSSKTEHQPKKFRATTGDGEMPVRHEDTPNNEDDVLEGAGTTIATTNKPNDGWGESSDEYLEIAKQRELENQHTTYPYTHKPRVEEDKEYGVNQNKEDSYRSSESEGMPFEDQSLQRNQTFGNTESVRVDQRFANFGGSNQYSFPQNEYFRNLNKSDEKVMTSDVGSNQFERSQNLNIEPKDSPVKAKNALPTIDLPRTLPDISKKPSEPSIAHRPAETSFAHQPNHTSNLPISQNSSTPNISHQEAEIPSSQPLKSLNLYSSNVSKPFQNDIKQENSSLNDVHMEPEPVVEPIVELTPLQKITKMATKGKF